MSIACNDFSLCSVEEYRVPTDKTLIRRLSRELKVMQAYVDEKNLPDILKNANDHVKSDIREIRGYFKRSLQFLVSHYAEIGKTIAKWEAGIEGCVTPMKWIQMT